MHPSICEHAQAIPERLLAFAGTVVFVEIAASAGTGASEETVVKMEIGAFVASEAFVVCQETAASGTEMSVVGLVTMSVLAHQAESST